MCDSLTQARDSCNKIDEMLKRKQLSVNHDKSKFLVIGNKAYRKKIIEETTKDPVKMGSITINHSEKEKYLGDWIHEKGCIESVSETIKTRINGLIGVCQEIIDTAEEPLMGINSQTGINLFEARVIPKLLTNCESWIGITDAHIAELQNFQDKFLLNLFHLPKSTTRALLHWDCNMKLMKWRIAERKLKFLSKLMSKDDKNIALRAVQNEMILGLKGLAFECDALANMIGIQNVIFNRVTKSEIKNAIKDADLNEKRAKMQNSKKVRDRLSDDPSDKEYLSFMSLPMSRIWIRHRARAIAGVKMNTKRSYKEDLSCRFCSEEAEETQEHLESCDGTSHERRKLNIELQGPLGRLWFWRRMRVRLLRLQEEEKKKKKRERSERDLNTAAVT